MAKSEESVSRTVFLAGSKWIKTGEDVKWSLRV